MKSQYIWKAWNASNKNKTTTLLAWNKTNTEHIYKAMFGVANLFKFRKLEVK